MCAKGKWAVTIKFGERVRARRKIFDLFRPRRGLPALPPIKCAKNGSTTSCLCSFIFLTIIGKIGLKHRRDSKMKVKRKRKRKISNMFHTYTFCLSQALTQEFGVRAYNPCPSLQRGKRGTTPAASFRIPRLKVNFFCSFLFLLHNSKRSEEVLLAPDREVDVYRPR
jgi:hypothetical protein